MTASAHVAPFSRGIGGTARALVIAISLTLLAPSLGFQPARAADLPLGFQETTVLSGLSNPTAVQFASDGRIFVAEKRGVIKVFDGLGDTTAVTFADLRTEVYNFWDRGLLGLALHPGFPATPYVYALYTYDAQPGGSAPRWGQPGADSDPCPTPPGATADGCVVTGRLTRMTASGNVSTASVPLITDWCQQYPSHSIGDLAFGADGFLYVSSGDGASFNFADWGQDGSPVNPCGDPPGGAGAAMSPPTAEGGALRSQDLRTPADPTSLDGTILRVDPLSGDAATGNPLIGSGDANARRIVAHGLRNPFRITVRPGTNEVWAGDVGWSTWEEINRVASPTAGVTNFGWPCFEGTGTQGSYDSANLNICEGLYSSGTTASPYFTYRHGQLVSNEACATGNGSSTAGLAFYDTANGTYPAEYDGALFFADYSRRCIWVMFAGANGLPDPATRTTFRTNAAGPVQLKIGPGGDLYYVDFTSGTLRRISYPSTNQLPIAQITASPTEGVVPLTVSFNGSGSSDADGDLLTYRWDLDADGALDDSTAVAPNYTYTAIGNYLVTLEVSDGRGGVDTASVTIRAGGISPTPTINTPTQGTTWSVGQTITFSGSATDFQDGTLSASALAWELIMQHCPADPTSCHEHPIQNWTGVASGSFIAPDHDYPSHLELRLVATDEGSATGSTSVELQPETTELTFRTSPEGLQLVVGAETVAAPLTQTYIAGTTISMSAPTPQVLDGTIYEFSSWSDDGEQTHTVVASQSVSGYTATFVVAPPRNAAPPVLRELLSYPPILFVSDGIWTGSQPMAFAYQWLRCATVQMSSCNPIEGATGKRYVPLPEDTGFRLRATVTATNSGGSASETTGATPPT